MVVVLFGQCTILELQTAVVDTRTDRWRKPFADGKAVRGFQASEKVFTTEWRTEKCGRTSGNADKPVAGTGHRKNHSVEINGLHRLKTHRDIIE